MNYKRRRPARHRRACNCGGKYAKNCPASSKQAASGSAKRLRLRERSAEES